MDEPVAESPGGGSASPEPRLRHRVLKTGESYGNYRIVKCIAPGLIVNYYRAQHVRDLREITLGIFHPRTVEDTKFLRRLFDLKQLTDKIQHDGIPAILDCAQVDRLHCIYMEPVEGTTLSEYFKEHTRGQEGTGCKEAETREIIAQILGLIGVAHSYGLDHRDLGGRPGLQTG